MILFHNDLYQNTYLHNPQQNRAKISLWSPVETTGEEINYSINLQALFSKPGGLAEDETCYYTRTALEKNYPTTGLPSFCTSGD